MFSEKKIAVIGAGITGLCAAKHAIAHGYDVTVYEQTSAIGGTWVYTDRVGTDESGLPVHTSMYKNLETNLPIEIMGFPDYPFPNKGRSFVSHEEVLDFFVSYAKHFNVVEKIKFAHYVVRVLPLKNERWEIIVKDLKSDTSQTLEFDYVFVCNGHQSVELIPAFPGATNFTGKQIHSRYYRHPDEFQGEDVLLIGAGPSGRDILHDVATAARRVTISTHANLSTVILPANVTIKPDISEIKANSVFFVDGSEQSFTTILYCTGYKFSFPFLSVDAGLGLLETYYIDPLYKMCININYPTMSLIGLQMTAVTTLIYDMQVQLCLKYWNKEKPMPSKAEMLLDAKRDLEEQTLRGYEKKPHFLADAMPDYTYRLSRTAGIDDIPDVLTRIYYDCGQLRQTYPNSYRLYNYRVIDNETFERNKIV